MEMLEIVGNDRIWKWLFKSDLKTGTEASLCAAQKQAISKNYVNHYIIKTSENSLCRLCGKKGESVQHLVSGCKKLAQGDYKRQLENTAKKINWDLCKKDGLEPTKMWFEHVPEGAVEKEEVKVLWVVSVQCNNLIEARRPGIVVIDKKDQNEIIFNIAVLRVGEKEREKVEKYQDLKRERYWKIVETQNGGSCAYSDRSAWECNKKI